MWTVRRPGHVIGHAQQVRSAWSKCRWYMQVTLEPERNGRSGRSSTSTGPAPRTLEAAGEIASDLGGTGAKNHALGLASISTSSMPCAENGSLPSVTGREGNPLMKRQAYLANVPPEFGHCRQVRVLGALGWPAPMSHTLGAACLAAILLRSQVGGEYHIPETRPRANRWIQTILDSFSLILQTT